MALLGLVTTLWCLPGLGVRATHGAHVAVDEPQYLLSATSLAEDFDLDIHDELRDERWRTYHQAALPVQTKRLAGDREVSPHDPLLPLLLAGPMAIGGWVGAKVAMATMAGALAAALLWVAVRRLGVPRGRAALAVGCFSWSSPLAVYGTQIYPELPGALALTLGVGAALGPPSKRCAWAVGLAVSAMPWLSVKYAPAAGALAAVYLWRLVAAGHRRLAAGVVGGLVVSGLAFAAGHLAIYDGLTPYATGDHFVGGELTVVGTAPNYLGRSRRLVGLFVDRNWGLIAWQPAWLLVLPALGAAVRRRPPWWAVVVAPLATGWAMATWAALTMHGFWWSGRQTVVVLPMAVLLVAWWAGRSWLVAGLVAGATTWWWLVVDGLRHRITWVVHVTAAGAPVHRLLAPLLPDLRAPGTLDQARWAAWSVVVVALLAVGWLARGDEDAGPGEGADADGAVRDLHGDRAVG
ncbi:MAG: hypothetical protein JWO68_139 [Actinomycetia bacterium]|nr:hypothetical protein [Actinomycetes bacterium]